VLYFEADDILEYEIMGEPITGLLRWRASKAIQYNLSAADCVICVSDALKDHLVNNWKVPSDKIVVFPNVADVQKFRPDPDARNAVRAMWDLGTRPVIIFVGNFYEWHDVKTLLESFSRVLLTCPDAFLILVGDGTQRQLMMKHASDLGIDESVRFTGLVAHNEIPNILAAADIAVVPYPPLSTDLWLSPLKLYEYMASGKAIIASAIGQLMEVIDDGRNGLLVPPGDIDSMTDALHNLILDSDLRRLLGRTAREDAMKKHSWEQYISRLEDVFSAVIEGQPLDSV
jgi:glycosyltransferase involved in cell wall biosynthesis